MNWCVVAMDDTALSESEPYTKKNHTPSSESELRVSGQRMNKGNPPIGQPQAEAVESSIAQVIPECPSDLYLLKGSVPFLNGCNFCDFLTGSIGGIAGLVSGYPADTVKVRQQAFGGKGILRTCRIIVRQEGPRGFFKGMMYPLLAAGLYNAMFFGWYGIGLRGVHTLEGIPASRSQVTALESAAAGAFAGFVSVSVLCPIDVIKIQMQTSLPATSELKVPGMKYHNHTSSTMLIKDMIARHGLLSLYRGVGPSLWRETCANTIYMGSYQFFQNTFGDTVFTNFVGGGIAGMASWGLTVPFDVVKSKVQSDNFEWSKYRHIYGGTWSTMRQCVLEEGRSVLFRGLTVSLIRAFPVNAVTFVAYSSSMKQCREVFNLGKCDD